MNEIKHFEDLECWQTARLLCNKIFILTCKKTFSKDFKFVAQVRNSSGSGMDNIAEGSERGGNREFIQFLYISKGSLGETRSQLYRALDQSYITSDELKETLELAFVASRKTQNLINILNRTNYKGHKYR